MKKRSNIKTKGNIGRTDKWPLCSLVTPSLHQFSLSLSLYLTHTHTRTYTLKHTHFISFIPLCLYLSPEHKLARTLTQNNPDRQFHQHFTYEFYVNSYVRRLFGSFFLRMYVRKKLPKRHSHEKFARIMLMKLTPAYPCTYIHIVF